MSAQTWNGLAIQQSGVLARRQLLELGFGADRVRNQVAARRWQLPTSTVVCTTTGELSREQRLWTAALHCGGESLVGGLSAAAVHGLRGWDRDDVTVLVAHGTVLDPVAGLRVVRTRRPLADLRDPTCDLPLCRLDPAALLHAAYTPSFREGIGLLAACVQQRLTTAERLRRWVPRLRPLRRSRLLLASLVDIEGGAGSMAEIDVTRMCRAFGLPRPVRQVRRRDGSGRLRYTDCEWRLVDGRVLVLEIDGAFHMDVAHWEDDVVRQRGLTDTGRLVVRATAREVRDEPASLVADLIRLGVRGRVAHDAR